jgi:hypothetical protein
MRDGFREIISGWTLIDDVDDISFRLEELARFSETNGPFEEDELKTIKLMIDVQVARAVRWGYFAPYIMPPETEPPC